MGEQAESRGCEGKVEAPSGLVWRTEPFWCGATRALPELLLFVGEGPEGRYAAMALRFPDGVEAAEARARALLMPDHDHQWLGTRRDGPKAQELCARFARRQALERWGAEYTLAPITWELGVGLLMELKHDDGRAAVVNIAGADGHWQVQLLERRPEGDVEGDPIGGHEHTLVAAVPDLDAARRRGHLMAQAWLMGAPSSAAPCDCGPIAP